MNHSHPLYADQMTVHKHQMFYDETNNFRKLILNKERGTLNTDKIEFNNTIFYLGGIALFDGYKTEHDLSEAFGAFKLKVNKEKTEIKFEDVAKKDFLSVLKSAHLNNYLKLLVEHKVCIHYQSIDVIYMITTELIDEYPVIEKFYEQYPQYYFEVMSSNICAYFKDVMHTVFRENRAEFLGFISETNFPYIKTSKEFIDQFIDFIKVIGTKKNQKQIAMILSVFENLPNKAKVYTDDYTIEQDTLLLMSSFSGYYWHRIVTLSNCTHIFDQEDHVQESFGETSINLKPIFKFVDSKSDFRIQMSDILIGFVRKFTDYHLKESIESIKENFSKMNTYQKECLKFYLLLEDFSEEVCPFFFLAVLPIGDKAKMSEVANFYKQELNLA